MKTDKCRFFFLPECPEQVHDNKTLYERLQEQKQKKQDEWDEQHQLSMYTNQLCDNYGGNFFLTASPLNNMNQFTPKGILSGPHGFFAILCNSRIKVTFTNQP